VVTDTDMDLIITELVRMLREALGGRFSTYEEGKRDLVGVSELPLLCVYPRNTSQRRSGTGNDSAAYDIAISAVVSVTGADNQPRIARVATQMDLVRAFEGRAPDGSALPNTVFGVLGGDLTVGGSALYTDDFQIAYDPPEDGDVTSRATMTLKAYTRPLR